MVNESIRRICLILFLFRMPQFQLGGGVGDRRPGTSQKAHRQPRVEKAILFLPHHVWALGQVRLLHPPGFHTASEARDVHSGPVLWPFALRRDAFVSNEQSPRSIINDPFTLTGSFAITTKPMSFYV